MTVARMYDIDGLFPHQQLAELPEGTTILITGPANVGKHRLVLSLLAQTEASDEQSLLVMTDGSIERVVSEYAVLSGTDEPTALSVIDASAGGGIDRTGTLPAERVATVGAPNNLTGTGIEIATYLRRMAGEDTGVRIGFDSLSTVLQYLGTDQVFSFTDVLTGRFTAAGYLSVFTMNSQAHDEHVLSVFKHEFDVIVDIDREEDGTQWIQVNGVPGVSGETLQFSQLKLRS